MAAGRTAAWRLPDADRSQSGHRRRPTTQGSPIFGLEDAADIADPEAAADDRLAGKDALEAVSGYVATLPARQRAAILLAADGERSNAEIGEAMGLSVGGVEQLLVRARRTLRKRLAEREGREEG